MNLEYFFFSIIREFQWRSQWEAIGQLPSASKFIAQ
jgi:hypothetical protein